ncbi:MAG: hypothetical protein ABMA64_23230 [Myxococcota bacterium]
MSPRIPALLFVVGCEAQPLPSVPVFGGTDEQQTAVREVLDGFDRDVGAGRVHLRRVVFDDRAFAGAYDVGSRTVTLVPQLPVAEIPRVLRHELCHALDFQEGLLARPDPLWDSVADDLFASGRVDPAPYTTARLRRAETLATYCGEGPWWSELTSSECADDPVQVRDLGQRLREDVWIDAAPMATTPQVVAAGRWPSGILADSLVVDPTEDPEVVRLRASRGDVNAWAAVRLAGGEPVFAYDLSNDAANPAVVADGWDLSPPALRVGWESGPSVAFASLDLYAYGAATRVLRTDVDGAWERVGDGCAPAVSALFAAQERAWLGWTAGETVWWGPITE